MRWTVRIDGGPRRVNHAAVCIEDKIYSFGGYCSTEEYWDWAPIPVHVLDTTTLRWAPVDYTNHDLSSSSIQVPFQRYGHTTVAYGHKVFMWGGRNNAVACDILSVFDTKTLEWSTPPVQGVEPYAKDGHSACVIGNRMYIFGGFEYLTDQYSQELHCLDLDTLKWIRIDTTGSTPSHRDFHTAIAVGDRMYVYGGRADLNSPYNSQEEVYCSQVHYLDTLAKKWVACNPSGTWPEGRRSHSAWYTNGSMYIFGGYNGNSKEHFNDLFQYDVKLNHWQYLEVNGAIPCKRRRQACLIYENKVFLFGGTSPRPHAANHPPPPVAPANADDNQERLIDNNDLHILDYAPTLKTLCILAVLAHNLDQSCLPRDIIFDIRMMTVPNRISRPINQAG